MSEPTWTDNHSEETTPLLRQRFEVGKKLGKGGQGTTYYGVDHHTGSDVAIKELGLDFAENWKAIELFEREGDALRNLDHPAIPSYVDAFHVEEDDGTVRFFLVQEFVEGRTFQDLIDDSAPIATDDAIDFLEHLLDILEYLHGLHPPVIHRDIKPSNLILRPDGSIALIDFGAVHVVRPHTLMGSTVVGTTGYVPPEQLAGRTVPASDLYALGATAIHLMTHIHPAELPVERMRLQFEKHIIEAPPPLLSFLRGAVEPVVEDRICTIPEARSILRGDGARQLPAVTDNSPPPVVTRPVGTRIRVEEKGQNMEVWLPASRRFRTIYAGAALLLLIGLGAAIPAVGTETIPLLAGVFCAILLVGQIFIAPTRLVLGPDTFALNRNTLNGAHRGWTEDLADIEVREAGEERLLMVLPVPSHLVLMEGVYPLHFGFGLTPVERRWVQGVVRGRLRAN